MQEVYLKILTRKDLFHPKVRLAVDSMTRCIIDIIVRHKGVVYIKQMEDVTGLKHISKTFTVDMIRYMAKEGIVEIRDDKIIGNVPKMTQILEQQKTRLPDNHGKPWSEMDYVRLAQMMIDKRGIRFIAPILKRTERSVQMQVTLLRKAYRLIPMIERNKALRDFLSEPASPNPLK